MYSYLNWFGSIQASLTAVTGGYVSFVGIRGDGIQGIIAIDDVALHRGSCPGKHSKYIY